jgi:hypothetical protein
LAALCRSGYRRCRGSGCLHWNQVGGCRIGRLILRTRGVGIGGYLGRVLVASCGANCHSKAKQGDSSNTG